MNRWVYAVLTVALTLCFHVEAQADVITSPGGNFQVGISELGELFDTDLATGFQRNSDSFDPLTPGIPRDSWGVSAGSIFGFANHSFYGVTNIFLNGFAVFGTNSASISTFLNDGLSVPLRIDQNYSFAAENVLKIATTVTNISGSPQAVRFSRNVDFDLLPNLTEEITTVDPFTGQIDAASVWGFENPDPLVPYVWFPLVPPAGDVQGPDDLGAAYQLDLGALDDGQSSFFDVFYAISIENQTPSELRNQLHSLGASFVITTESGDGSGDFSAALGYSPPGAPGVVPEPAAFIVWSLLGALCISVGWWRRRQAA